MNEKILGITILSVSVGMALGILASFLDKSKKDIKTAKQAKLVPWPIPKEYPNCFLCLYASVSVSGVLNNKKECSAQGYKNTLDVYNTEECKTLYCKDEKKLLKYRKELVELEMDFEKWKDESGYNEYIKNKLDVDFEKSLHRFLIEDQS